MVPMTFGVKVIVTGLNVIVIPMPINFGWVIVEMAGVVKCRMSMAVNWLATIEGLVAIVANVSVGTTD
jgi:hypothetical protein